MKAIKPTEQKPLLILLFYGLQIFESLGVGDLFQATANFSALTEDQGVVFDDAVHQAKIQIDEHGKIFI